MEFFYVEIGVIVIVFYFVWFIVIVFFVGIVENILMDIVVNEEFVNN